MDYLTAKVMSEKWNISRRRIATLCKECRINGVILKEKAWLITSDAEKPDNPRKTKISL